MQLRASTLSAHFSEKLTRRRSCNRTEVCNQVRLVIVSGTDGDIGPHWITAALCRTERTLESSDLEERLWTQPDNLLKDPAQVPFADAQTLGHGRDMTIFKMTNRTPNQPLARIEAGSRLKPLGDGCLQCSKSSPRIPADSKLFFQTLRGLSIPQITKRNDAPCQLRCGFTKNRVTRTQWQANKHRALPTTNRLAMNLEARPHRMDIKATGQMSTESHDQMHSRVGNRDSRRIRLALVRKSVRHRIQQAGTALMRHFEALEHRPIVNRHPHQGKWVRFLQFV
jgi:hypothetical protein